MRADQYIPREGIKIMVGPCAGLFGMAQWSDLIKDSSCNGWRCRSSRVWPGRGCWSALCFTVKVCSSFNLTYQVKAWPPFGKSAKVLVSSIRDHITCSFHVVTIRLPTILSAAEKPKRDWGPTRFSTGIVSASPPFFKFFFNICVKFDSVKIHVRSCPWSSSSNFRIFRRHSSKSVL